jgi:hypothetical protein
MILDIGPDSAAQFAALVAKAGTIVWNGPVGVFEFEAVLGRHAGARAGHRRFRRLLHRRRRGHTGRDRQVRHHRRGRLHFDRRRRVPRVSRGPHAAGRRRAPGAGLTPPSTSSQETAPMIRATKIVATLGPASSDSAVLERMMACPASNVVRVNFSHGTADEHTAVVERVREVAVRLGRDIGVLADLQGPKIRIGKFSAGKIIWSLGDRFIVRHRLRTRRPAPGRPRLQGPGQRRACRRQPAAQRRPDDDAASTESGRTAPSSAR